MEPDECEHQLYFRIISSNSQHLDERDCCLLELRKCSKCNYFLIYSSKKNSYDEIGRGELLHDSLLLYWNILMFYRHHHEGQHAIAGFYHRQVIDFADGFY